MAYQMLGKLTFIRFSETAISILFLNRPKEELIRKIQELSRTIPLSVTSQHKLERIQERLNNCAEQTPLLYAFFMLDNKLLAID